MTYEYDFVSATDAKTFQKDVQGRSEDPDGPWEVVELGVAPLAGAKKANPTAGSDSQEQTGIFYWMFCRRTRKGPPPAAAAPAKKAPAKKAAAPAKKAAPSKAVLDAIEETAIDLYVEEAETADPANDYTEQDFYSSLSEGEQDAYRSRARESLYGDE